MIEFYFPWLLVSMHNFISCTKRVICLHNFIERGIHCMAFCLDAQFGFLHTTLFKTCHLSAQVYRTRYTLHGFLFHFFCAFVCKRVFSHIKSSRLLEVTSRVNSCRVVTTRRHISTPHSRSMTISGDCSQTSCRVCQLPVRMTS